MTSEVLEIFGERVSDSALFIDATLGAGGHTSELLDKFPRSRVVAFDQDGQARTLAAQKLSRFGDRVRIVGANFRELAALSGEDGWTGADGILFDLGVSSMQLVMADRGFSFQEDGPLDMRMDPDGDGPTAREVLAELNASELAKIFRDYGEERHAWRIAKAIERTAKTGEGLERTMDLVSLIRRILPAPVQRKMGGHPARRVFQALRIAVNSELDALDEGLDGALSAAGSLCVIIAISYHSLEDRMIKRRFLKWAGEGHGNVLTRRPLTPGEEETESNRSSRSAKLRAFITEGTENR
jgi:16S rRNA (cytosine1402-N4)-methyltransferase